MSLTNLISQKIAIWHSCGGNGSGNNERSIGLDGSEISTIKA
jgi:hypothetical protein